MTVAARPFIKWVGGKTYLLPEIKKRIPSAWNPETDLYVEPFLGAGALFWDLKPKHAYLNDANELLKRTWYAVQNAVDGLVTELRQCEQEYRNSPETYYHLIRDCDVGMGTVEDAARFIFLNKTGFNGLYRVNGRGEFNVPWGKDPKRTICDAELLHACSAQLQNATLFNADFEELTFDPEGAFIYCDPPYMPVSKTSNFTSYTADGFSYYDQLRLAVWAADMRNAGAYIILSQSAFEPLIDQYRMLGFTCDLVNVPRRVNSKGTGRGNVGEYIIY